MEPGVLRCPLSDSMSSGLRSGIKCVLGGLEVFGCFAEPDVAPAARTRRFTADPTENTGLDTCFKV